MQWSIGWATGMCPYCVWKPCLWLGYHAGKDTFKEWVWYTY